MMLYDNHMSAAENAKIHAWLARHDRRAHDAFMIWRWFLG